MTAAPRNEHAIQAAFVEGFRLCAGDGALLFSIPNEHPPAWLGRLVALGLAQGFPDLGILWPGGVGFIEFKDPRGTVSALQQFRHGLIRQLGHHVTVARSVEEAWAAIAQWGVPLRRAIADGHARLQDTGS